MSINKSLFEFTTDINEGIVRRPIKNSLQLNYSLLNDKKKSLGQNFTSQIIVDLMISLSEKDHSAKILEPSAGLGVFVERLKEMGFRNIDAYEIDPAFCENNQDVQNKEFLTLNLKNDYDLVIGNPPYVRWKHMPKEIQVFLSNSPFWKNRVNALSDLLQTFIFKGVDLLKENGELIFITPYFWLQSLHASKLREFLSLNGYIDTLIHFGEHKLFNDAASNFIIFRYVKTRKNENKKIKFVELTDKKSNLIQNIDKINKALIDLNTNRHIEYGNIKAFLLEQFKTSDTWDLVDSNNNRDLLKFERNSGFSKIFKNGKIKFCYNNNKNTYLKFSDICRIGAGMVTGYDKAFKLKDQDIEKFTELEKKQVIYFIKSKDMDRFFYIDQTSYIRVDQCKNEEELKLNFPNIYSHLLTHKKELEKRFDYGVKWYQYSFLRNLDLFIQNPGPKIFIPSKDRKPYSRFIYVDKPFFCGQDACAIVLKDEVSFKEDLKYILALLNSDIINKWYRHKGIKRGEVLQYSFEPMSKIPIRLINWDDAEEVKIYNEILRLIDEVIQSKRYNEHISKINEFVEYLYSKD